MSYLLAFLGFAALIILHEFGHFAAAKAVGMRVERFSLFFGPLLVRFRRGETEYGIGPIPLGGYVRITGMNPREELDEDEEIRRLRERLAQLRAARAEGPAPDEELKRQERTVKRDISDLQDRAAAIRSRAYFSQPVWKRIVVILAGPAVNLLIAFLLLFGIFWSQGLPLNHGKMPVWEVVGQLQPPGSHYLKVGDQLVRVDGVAYPSEAELAKAVNSHTCGLESVNGCQATTPVKLVVKRDQKLVDLTIYPRFDASVGRMLIGFTYNQATGPVGPVAAARTSVSQMWWVTHTTVSTVARLFEPKVRRQLHSVVGGFKITQQRFSYSASEALYTLAVISLSLAIINLFPFLPLDGGHVFWALAEKVRGKRIPFEVMERAGAVGFALILIVFVIGLSNDISTLAGSGFKVH